MNIAEVKNLLIQKNNYLSNTLVDGFINDTIIKYLPIYVIEYCALNEETQRVLIGMNEKQLKIVSQIIKYASDTKQDWIPLGASYVHFIKDGHYNELCNALSNCDLDDELVNSFLFLINNGGNFFNVKSIDDIRNIDEIRRKRNIDLSDTNDPNLILLSKYGLSYDRAFNFYNRYGKDVGLLPDSFEKEFLLDIKNIIEGRGTKDRGVCNDIDFLNSVDSRMRNLYARIYNKELYKLEGKTPSAKASVEGKEIPIYDAGVDFVMSIYSYGLATNLETPENYRNDWIRPNISVDYMCNSIINSVNMRTSVRHCVYGFGNFDFNDLALLSANDLGTGGIYGEVNVTNPYHQEKLIADVEFRVPGELINNTRFTQNEVYRKRRREVNGQLERVEPDYIVYFKTKEDYKNDSIWLESLNAAMDFDIPIVMIDCEMCLVHNLSRVDTMISEFESRYDNVEIIRTIIETLYSIRTGYKVAENLLNKHLSNERQYAMIARITDHIDEISKLAPSTALKCIDLFLDTLDDEYKKNLKSSYWVKQAEKQGYTLNKPTNVIAYLEELKVKINARLNGIDEYSIDIVA